MQPPYPAKGEALKVLEWQINELRKLDPGEAELVIFPENSNCTGYIDAEDMKNLRGIEKNCKTHRLYHHERLDELR